MKNCLLVIVIAFYSLTCVAQQSAKFHSQNYIGLLEGSQRSMFQVQSINGFQYKTWFAGIGTGLDYYYFRSVPLFLSLNKYFCPCERSLFVSADGGYNWVWDEQTGNRINSYQNGDFEPGLYWGLGLGYKIGLRNNKDALLLNLGYSAKYLTEKIATYNWCGWQPCPDLTYTTNKYNLSRLSMRIGWQF